MFAFHSKVKTVSKLKTSSLTMRIQVKTATGRIGDKTKRRHAKIARGNADTFGQIGDNFGRIGDIIIAQYL